MNPRLKFRQRIPLFQDLPDNLFNSLDMSGFSFPQGEIEDLRAELEQILDQYVVSYKGDVFNTKVLIEEHLCALVKGADLNSEQLAQLKKYENLSKKFNVTFVVFQRPLEIIKDIKTTAVYQYYAQKGLV